MEKFIAENFTPFIEENFTPFIEDVYAEKEKEKLDTYGNIWGGFD